MMPGGRRLGFHEARRASDEMRLLRKARGLSQVELAAVLGTTANWVGQRETGAIRLRERDAELVAKALGTDLARLTGGAT